MPSVNKIKISDPLSVASPYLDEIKSTINRVIKSGWYIGGEEVTTFENEFSQYLNVNYTISTGSGTDALQLALRSLGISTGDGVVTVSHTSVATVAAIEMVGAIPILVDIDPKTFTIDIKELHEVLVNHNSKPEVSIKAIIPVHIYGHPANMIEVMSLAKQYNALVIEDCAQAHGATIQNKKCGTWGHAAIFSFYPTKNLGCFGDGGAMVTNDSIVCKRAKLIKEYGWERRYISEIPGINTRLDSIQAAILRVRLKYLDIENKRRNEIANEFIRAINNTSLILPYIEQGFDHVFHQFVIRTSHRDYLIKELMDKGITTSILYPQPIHLQPAYYGRIETNNELKVTEKICNEILSIPVHPVLSNNDIESIIKTLNKREI